jgi:hypothetical protein
LAGHAYVPFNTVATAPKDAGKLFETSGKFANDPRQRVEKLGSVAANTFVGDPKNPRASGGFLPVKGQAVQGFSGIHSIGDGSFLALTDNGFEGQFDGRLADGAPRQARLEKRQDGFGENHFFA